MMILVAVKISSAELEQFILNEDVIVNRDTIDDFYKENTRQITKNDIRTNNTNDVLLIQRCKDIEADRIIHVFQLCLCAVHLFRNSWKKSLRMAIDGQTFSCLMYTATVSDIFRRNLIETLFRNKTVSKRNLAIPCRLDNRAKHLQLEINLTWPEHLTMDKAWNMRMLTLVEERKELELMMAWLSTLGGAYSALGDDFYHCAEVAGKISLNQLKIAFKLGDPITLAKCKVYFAISLLQRGYVNKAIALIREQYAYSMALPENLRDTRLTNMCKGVWARIKYVRSLKKHSASDRDRVFP